MYTAYRVKAAAASSPSHSNAGIKPTQSASPDTIVSDLAKSLASVSLTPSRATSARRLSSSSATTTPRLRKVSIGGKAGGKPPLPLPSPTPSPRVSNYAGPHYAQPTTASQRRVEATTPSPSPRAEGGSGTWLYEPTVLKSPKVATPSPQRPRRSSLTSAATAKSPTSVSRIPRAPGVGLSVKDGASEQGTAVEEKREFTPTRLPEYLTTHNVLPDIRLNAKTLAAMEHQSNAAGNSTTPKRGGQTLIQQSPSPRAGFAKSPTRKRGSMGEAQTPTRAFIPNPFPAYLFDESVLPDVRLSTKTIAAMEQRRRFSDSASPSSSSTTTLTGRQKKEKAETVKEKEEGSVSLPLKMASIMADEGMFDGPTEEEMSLLLVLSPPPTEKENKENDKEIPKEEEKVGRMKVDNQLVVLQGTDTKLKKDAEIETESTPSSVVVPLPSTRQEQKKEQNDMQKEEQKEIPKEEEKIDTVKADSQVVRAHSAETKSGKETKIETNTETEEETERETVIVTESKPPLSPAAAAQTGQQTAKSNESEKKGAETKAKEKGTPKLLSERNSVERGTSASRSPSMGRSLLGVLAGIGDHVRRRSFSFSSSPDAAVGKDKEKGSVNESNEAKGKEAEDVTDSVGIGGDGVADKAGGGENKSEKSISKGSPLAADGAQSAPERPAPVKIEDEGEPEPEIETEEAALKAAESLLAEEERERDANGKGKNQNNGGTSSRNRGRGRKGKSKRTPRSRR